MRLDVLVRGGEVIDGTGAPARPADIGVQDGRVVAVGRLGQDLLVAARLNVSVVIDSPPTTTDEGLRALLRHPAHVGGSDGIFIGGHPHPRGWGAFARYLGVHVRQLGDGTWPQAVAHLATNPAARFGLTDRGALRTGAAADLVVLDPATVGDRAGYGRPASWRTASTTCWSTGSRCCAAAG